MNFLLFFSFHSLCVTILKEENEDGETKRESESRVESRRQKKGSQTERKTGEQNNLEQQTLL